MLATPASPVQHATVTPTAERDNAIGVFLHISERPIRAVHKQIKAFVFTDSVGPGKKSRRAFGS